MKRYRKINIIATEGGKNTILSSGSATLHLRLPCPHCQVYLHHQQGKTGQDIFILFVFVFCIVTRTYLYLYLCFCLCLVFFFVGGGDSGWFSNVAHGPKNLRQEVLRPLFRLVIIVITVAITIVIIIKTLLNTISFNSSPSGLLDSVFRAFGTQAV